MARSFQAIDHLAKSLDFGCILLAFAGASAFASMLSAVRLFTWPHVPGQTINGWPTDYVVLLITSLIVWAVIASYTEVHRVDRIESPQHSYFRLARVLLLWVGATGTAVFFLKLQIVSRQFNLSFFILVGGLILLRRFCERAMTLHPFGHHRPLRSAIVIGPPDGSEWLLNILAVNPNWYGPVVHADLERVKATLQSAANQAPDHLNEELAEVFILPGSADQQTLEDWTLRFLRQGRTVHVIPAILDAQLFRQTLGDIAGVPTLTLETGTPSSSQALVKRTADLAVSLPLLLLLSPLMGFVALLVKLTSRGPVLFMQTRLGQSGLPFTMFKFRTMRTDAEAMLKADQQLYRQYVEHNFKLPDGEDLRVTSLGRVLRATSLDELPQLLNVLFGAMSLVGPRPIVPEELDKYGEYKSLLLMVKPGMTGNWQVNGRSRIIEYADRVRLDMEYVRDQSLAADLRILIRTVGAVARMDGAH